MGECPTPSRHAARPTLCVGGPRRRLPCTGLGATQATTDPVRDWRSEVSNTRSTRQTGQCKRRPECTTSRQVQCRTKAEACPASNTHTYTYTRSSTNRRAQRQVRMSIPRQLVIKQDKACSTPVGAFLQYRAEEEAHPAPVHEGLQPSAAAQSAKPRACKGQTQTLSRFSTRLWECFGALTSMSLHFFTFYTHTHTHN